MSCVSTYGAPVKKFCDCILLTVKCWTQQRWPDFNGEAQRAREIRLTQMTQSSLHRGVRSCGSVHYGKWAKTNAQRKFPLGQAAAV
ncbi:hypothetical protein V5799_030059 [Amblyomma americanum]|uniref:Uncharacterized protein n=1 Tax=Amblyomma americanum TaxID=6943 RepID=A0AAQ4EPW5_AMBAM